MFQYKDCVEAPNDQIEKNICYKMLKLCRRSFSFALQCLRIKCRLFKLHQYLNLVLRLLLLYININSNSCNCLKKLIEIIRLVITFLTYLKSKPTLFFHTLTPYHPFTIRKLKIIGSCISRSRIFYICN